jgi:hypothetical protein
MRRKLPMILAALVPLSLVACGGHDATIDPASSTSALSAGLPRRAELTLNLPVNASVGTAGTAVPATTPPASCVAGSPATFATMTGQIMQQSNGVLQGVLSLLDNATSGPPADAGPGAAVWGPINTPGKPAVYRVEVVALGGGSFHFELDGSPTGGSEGSWAAVMQGTIVAPDPTNRVGNVQVDFGVAHTVDPTSDPVAGGVALAFQATPTGLTLDETFADIVGPSAPTPNDAHYHLVAGPPTATFDYVTTTDFLHNGGSELLNVQSQWLAVGAGMANVVVTGGDLGSKTVQAAECWNASQAAVFYEDDVSANPPTGNQACCPP